MKDPHWITFTDALGTVSVPEDFEAFFYVIVKMIWCHHCGTQLGTNPVYVCGCAWTRALGRKTYIEERKEPRGVLD